MSTKAAAATLSFSEGVQAMVRTALSHMKLPEGGPESILAGHSVLQVRLPIKLDDGRYHVFTGGRAVHSDHRLPAKDGIGAELNGVIEQAWRMVPGERPNGRRP